MVNVLIAWSRLGDEQSNEKFKQMLLQIVTSVRTVRYETDERHVSFAETIGEVDDYIRNNTCDLLICDENLKGEGHVGNIGAKTLKHYRNTNPDMNVILVCNNERKSKGKMMSLYNEGLYNCLFMGDLKPKMLAQRIMEERLQKEAFAYYGLDKYEDLFTGSKAGKKDSSSKKKEQDNPESKVSMDGSSEATDGASDIEYIGSDKPEPPKRRPKLEEREEYADDGEGASDVEYIGGSDDGASQTYDTDVTSDTDDIIDDDADIDADVFGAGEKVPGKMPEDGFAMENGNKSGSRAEDSMAGEGTGTDDTVAAEQTASSNGKKKKKKKSGEQAPVMSSEDAMGGFDMTASSDSAGAGGDGTALAPAGDSSGEMIDLGADGSGVDAGDGIGDRDKVGDRAGDGSGSIEPPERKKAGAGTTGVAERMDDLSGEDAAKMLLKEDLSDVLAYINEKSEGAMSVEVVERQSSSVDDVIEAMLVYYTEKDNTFFRNLRDGIATREEFEEDLWQRIHAFDGLTDLQAQDAFAQFGRFMWGYDILEPFLVDKEVSDVKVLAPDHVQIKRKGRKRPVTAQFRSPSHYRAFVSRLAHRNHVDIHNNDIAIFTDTRSFEDVRLRVNITTEYINSSGFPGVHIRKINNIKYTTEQLIEAGMFGPRTAAYLINAAQNYSGIVFTGKGSAGKTTLMNYLIDYVPKDMSGLCIQESDELFTKTHPFIQFQRVTTNADGKKAYSLKDLSINGLLTDIDYFFIGETKGAEAKYFTNAAYTGNRCWTSVHSPNSHGALPKIADYAKYESDYTKDDILQMLTSLQCVVFLKNFKVAQISEVMGWDSDRREIIYKDIPLDDPADYKKQDLQIVSY